MSSSFILRTLLPGPFTDSIESVSAYLVQYISADPTVWVFFASGAAFVLICKVAYSLAGLGYGLQYVCFPCHFLYERMTPLFSEIWSHRRGFFVSWCIYVCLVAVCELTAGSRTFFSSSSYHLWFFHSPRECMEWLVPVHLLTFCWASFAYIIFGGNASLKILGPFSQQLLLWLNATALIVMIEVLNYQEGFRYHYNRNLFFPHVGGHNGRLLAFFITVIVRIATVVLTLRTFPRLTATLVFLSPAPLMMQKQESTDTAISGSTDMHEELTLRNKFNVGIQKVEDGDVGEDDNEEEEEERHPYQSPRVISRNKKRAPFNASEGLDLHAFSLGRPVRRSSRLSNKDNAKSSNKTEKGSKIDSDERSSV